MELFLRQSLRLQETYDCVKKNPYRLKQIDGEAKFCYLQKVEMIVSLTVDSAPFQFTCTQHYPIPFNPIPIIGFMIQVSGCTPLKTYNVIGQEIISHVNDSLVNGIYHHETIHVQGSSGGLYFIRFVNNNKVQRRKKKV